MHFSLSFPTANPFNKAKGKIKSFCEDFYVEEKMSIELTGEGEHVWLLVEKRGQNTEYVAKLVARFAGVRVMDVGFSGLKDRWAQTRQWLSVYIGNRVEPDWSGFEAEGVEILKVARHCKKLRRGEHESNLFRLVIRDLQDDSELNEGLVYIRDNGFPNYFGLQRFGFDGSNLERGLKYFNGDIKASRSQRSFYLSAARSYLFNLNLANAVRTESWQGEDGPLYGDLSPDHPPLSDPEEKILADHPVFAKGIHKNRLSLERRPYQIVPKAMSWVKEDDMLSVSFELPKGVFATTLLNDAIDIEDVSVRASGTVE